MIEPFFSATLALIAAFCWGANSHIIRIGMKGENLFLGLFYRSIFTFPILLILSIFVSQPNVVQIYFSFNETTLFIFLSVICVLLGDSFFMFALKEFPVNLIMPIAAIYPLATTIILITFGIEEISSLVIIGTLVIIVGVSIVTKYGNNGNGDTNVSRKAIFLALGSAFSWGTSVVFVNLVLKNPGSDPTSLTGFRTLLLGFVSLFIFIIFARNNTVQRSKQDQAKTFSFMALSGLIGWVFGATIFFIAVQNIGASIPTPISSINPVIAVIIGYVLKFETISIKQFLGVILSVTGTIIIVL